MTIHRDETHMPREEAKIEQTFAQTLGAAVKARRIRAGMLQSELAQRLGKSQQSVSKWESGATLPGTEDIARIANILDVPVDYLLKESMQEVRRRHGAPADESTDRLLVEISERLEKDSLTKEIAEKLTSLSPQKRELLFTFLRSLTSD